MREAEFREWLKGRGANTEEGRNTRVHAVKTIERNLAELGSPDRTLEDAWRRDQFEQLRARIRRIREDARDGRTDFRILMPQSQNPFKRLSSWNSWLAQYGRFLSGEDKAEIKDADRIRHYVLEHYIEPGREEGRDSVDVLVSDVNRALGLNQAWPNICQALAGKMFQDLAEVPAPERIGADQSSATVFRFDLSDGSFSWGEAELRRRYGEPIVDTDKMSGFALRDGRHVALQRDVKGTQIWVEDPGTQPGSPVQSIRRYTATQPRHSNLPSRLKHTQSQANTPRPVALITVGNLNELRSVLNWYEGTGTTLNAAALELLKKAFLARFPDFVNFERPTGVYWSRERVYKDRLIERVAQLTRVHAGDTDEVLGRAILDLLTENHPLLYSGMRNSLKRRVNGHPELMGTAVGRLVRADDMPAALEHFGRETWEVFTDDGTKPYADVRRIGSMICALVRPSECLGVWSAALDDTAKLLTGRRLFSNGLITAAEYRGVSGLANELKRVMAEQWQWQPRDLWDVHALIGSETDVPKIKYTSEEPTMDAPDSMHEPTNLILYGPPGTGKTFATAEEALRLCGEAIPDDREELMAIYRRLTEAGRIEFVTFHQSYAYEEFVEGLRPVQGEEGSAGFHLQPEPGVLRRVARRAETSTGSGGPAFTIGDRQIFKMSIGRANDPEDAYLFEEAIENGYALIGFDNLDWSDRRFESRDEIIARLKAEGDREGEINPYAGRVQSPDIFRNWVRTGDLIVVSKGNLLFRAIGEVVGDYEYAPRSDGTYSHRRGVKWLWVDRAGVPVEEIYSAKFSQRTIYLLTKKELNVPALERYVESQREGGGEPDQFVLIIDEINRANVSKVMGELITLLEPDKRIGATNELRIRLPYSRDMFGLPPNLHLIGTMNTADRSIALLDTALRRRFKFREVAPEPQLLADTEAATGLPLVAFLSMINDRIEYLLDREHRIGHAYFIKCRTRKEVDGAMRNAIIPLLQEYFFEDLSRVAVVLGEPKGGGFLGCRQIKDPLGEGEARDSWIVLPEFAEDAYDRCAKPDTSIHLVEPAAQAAE
jgi:hypothetical protein